MNPIVSFEKNTTGSDYVVGDIHGCFHLLRRLLTQVNFNPEIDRLFSVGDLIDRGPHSEEVLEWLDYPWFHPIYANHEHILVTSFEELQNQRSGSAMTATHLTNGGAWFQLLETEQQCEYAQRLSQLPWGIEIEVEGGITVGLVHAEVPYDDWSTFKERLKNPEKPEVTSSLIYVPNVLERKALWSKDIIRGQDPLFKGVANIHMVCVGHKIVPAPIYRYNVLYLDTGAYEDNGRMTMYCLNGKNAKQFFHS